MRRSEPADTIDVALDLRALEIAFADHLTRYAQFLAGNGQSEEAREVMNEASSAVIRAASDVAPKAHTRD